MLNNSTVHINSKCFLFLIIRLSNFIQESLNLLCDKHQGTDSPNNLKYCYVKFIVDI